MHGLNVCKEDGYWEGRGWDKEKLDECGGVEKWKSLDHEGKRLECADQEGGSGQTNVERDEGVSARGRKMLLAAAFVNGPRDAEPVHLTTHPTRDQFIQAGYNDSGCAVERTVCYYPSNSPALCWGPSSAMSTSFSDVINSPARHFSFQGKERKRKPSQ